MNFTEAVNEVIAITKRPDKIGAIQREVNAAINFFCLEADFARDRTEQTIAISAASYAGNIAMSDLTRFRKVDCLRYADRNKFLSLLDPKYIFTKEGCEITDVYYIAGSQINYKLANLSSSLLIAYYSFPPILAGTETFWLLDVSPYMVIDRVASKIFANIGDDASARTHAAFSLEAYTSAKRDYKYGSNP